MVYLLMVASSLRALTRGPQVEFLGATDAHAHRRESTPGR